MKTVQEEPTTIAQYEPNGGINFDKEEPTMHLTLTGLEWLLVYIAAGAIAAMSLAPIIQINKTWFALLGAGAAIATAYLNGAFPDPRHAGELISAKAADIAFFLTIALVKVGSAEAADVFKHVANWLIHHEKNPHKLAYKMGLLFGFLSMFLDNMTAAVMGSRTGNDIYSDDRMRKIGPLLANQANNFGVISVIGDVTSLMLWQAGVFGEGLKGAGTLAFFTLVPVMTYAFLQSRDAFKSKFFREAVLKQLDQRSRSELQPAVIVLSVLVVVGLLTAAIPAVWGMPAYFGPAFIGLPMLGITMDLMRRKYVHTAITHVDMEGVITILGLIAMVAVLEIVGIFDKVAHDVIGAAPSFWLLIAVIFVVGMLSAVVDNIPLTAAMIVVLKAAGVEDPLIWGILAFAVGVGGNLLVYGSAATIAMMHEVHGMNFVTYARNAFLPNMKYYTLSFGAALLFAAGVMLVRGDISRMLTFLS